MAPRAWISSALLLLCPAPRASGAFFAAAGKADITPDFGRETVWLAGYGSRGRRARSAHDPLYARALVVSDGRKLTAVVAVDSIGVFREDVLELRRSLGWEGEDRYLFLAATHDHAAPDTLGLWGRWIGFSGVDRRYRRRWKEAVLRLVADLSENLQEAELSAAKTALDPSGLCKDNRDPVVIDPELYAVQFRRKGGDRRALATVVRWSCHPEVLFRDNFKVSADYPGPLCARIEAETGGGCVFLSGLLGGLLSPEVDRSGGVAQELAEAKRVGERVAGEALAILAGTRDRGLAGSVSFDSRVVRVPVENSRYLLFLRSIEFGHRLLDAGGRPIPAWRRWWLPLRHLVFFPLPERLRPWVETEISRVRLGPVDILGIPGEMFPELALGGYDGRYRFRHPLLRPANPAPPDLSKAPRGPYLREKLGSRYPLLVGLANDELGYIVPEYDFKVRPNRSLEPRPPGHHYEETNSVGVSAARILLDAYDAMLARP